MTQAVDPSGTYSFAFDNLGRLTGTTTNYAFLTGRTLTESYGYDAASNRTSFTDPEGGVTNYAYDTLNRLTGLTDFNSNPFAFSYDALGRRTNLTRPNGVSTSYQYDALSRLLSILHQSSAFTGGTSYAYDAVGNRVSRTDTFQLTGQNPTQTVTNYGYDAIYELTQAVVNGVTAESYAYDAVGNRVSSLGIPSYSYNSSNELTSASPATFTYDANGNMTGKTAPNGTTSYTWDFENRLTSVMLPKGTVLHYQYDPFGRRIFSDGTGRIFVYDGDNVIEDLDLSGKSVARYTQGLGIDEPLEETASGASSYYEADGLGSITSLTSASGAIANTYNYDSFGIQTASSGTVSNRFFFTARENVAKTGLLYYRARYYDPSVGRFLSEDPVQFDLDLGNTNFYDYANNNPMDLEDPFGLSSLVFDRGSGTMSLYSSSGNYYGTYGDGGFDQVESFEAGNFTPNPNGNPNTIGCHCPAPNGTYPVLTPVVTGRDKRYGPYFFPIGAPGSRIRQRGIGLHGGRQGPKSITWGCIRVSNTTIKALYDYNKIDPIIQITIQ